MRRESVWQASLVVALSAGVALWFYLRSLPPGLTWAFASTDGGDFLTAAYHLGIPHPSGYPTYTLLAHLFTRLPLGEVAWRLNLLSALSMAGATGGLALIVYTLRPAEARFWLWPPLLAGWSFAFAPLVWSQAIVTEVYALNALFLVGLIALSLYVQRTERAAGWLGALWGVGLGVHLTLLAALPWVLWAMWPQRRKIVNPLALGLLAGAMVFLYLPLRAGAGPITWENPATLSGFWRLVTGALYQDYLFATPPHLLGPRLAVLLTVLTPFGGLSLFLAALGGYQLWKTHPAAVLAAVTSAGLYVGYALSYYAVDSNVYLIPAWLWVSLGVGWGSGVVLAEVSRWRAWGAWTLGAILALWLVGAAVVNLPELDLRSASTAEDFWQGVLAESPPNAVLLVEAEAHTFALWYGQLVQGLRPDVAVVDVRLAAYNWHRADLAKLYQQFENPAEVQTLTENGFVVEYAWPVCKVSWQMELDVDQNPLFTKFEATETLWTLTCVPPLTPKPLP